VESAGRKWEDVEEKMKEVVILLDSLEGIYTPYAPYPAHD
jgi:hypothetical protein